MTINNRLIFNSNPQNQLEPAVKCLIFTSPVHKNPTLHRRDLQLKPPMPSPPPPPPKKSTSILDLKKNKVITPTPT